MFDYQQVKLVACTYPVNIESCKTAEDFIVYSARVSNPANQSNMHTADKLLKYLIDHSHFSPFEMVHVVMEIKTTRDIGRQILRHRSFSFQEFSQRYAAVVDMQKFRVARMQDKKNRQNSVTIEDFELQELFNEATNDVAGVAEYYYKILLDRGIAKEQARAILPEGLTLTTMYMSGTLRSWMHYCKLRCAHGTQKEHMDIANKAQIILCAEFPSLREYLIET